LVVELVRTGPARRRGVGTMRSVPYRPDGGDIDLDASLDALVVPGRIDAEELRIRSWVRPGTALCLLGGRSGAVGGAPLASGAGGGPWWGPGRRGPAGGGPAPPRWWCPGARPPPGRPGWS